MFSTVDAQQEYDNHLSCPEPQSYADMMAEEIASYVCPACDGEGSIARNGIWRSDIGVYEVEDSECAWCSGSGSI